MRPIWSHVRPNFSRVRLTKIPGRTGASSHSRKEKKVSATQKLCGSTKDTPVRLISWSKPIRDSEGRTPPLIGRGRASRDRHSKYILYVHVFKCLQYTHIYYGNKNLDFWQIMAINGN